jgi:hypothetical protein
MRVLEAFEMGIAMEEELALQSLLDVDRTRY